MSEAQADPETSPSSDTDAPKPKSKALRRVFIASQVLLGVGLGLFATEKVFAARDEGAFPHVNFYVADPELGVRLQPGASMKFRFRDNPMTTIEINSAGYRGGEWPAAGEGTDEIIVVGDSQVFGLGVEREQTFSAQLEEATGRTVINAGVPTYGPAEYYAVAEELLTERKPKTLVVVLNFLNDPFELEHSNLERHAVWDGWAVRAEFAPQEVRDFPGRSWLYSQSHAFYALRRYLNERGKPAGKVVEGVDFGTPSEGSFGDLVGESEAAHAARAEQASQLEAEQKGARERLAKIAQERTDKRDSLDQLLMEHSEYQFSYRDAELAGGDPGDIVEAGYEESSRGVTVTAAMIRAAARERKRYLQRLLKKKRGTEAGQARELLEADERLASEREELRRKIAAGVPLLPPPPSLFGAYLDQLAALCEAHGTELVVMALPIDVQVDASEWDKYGVEERPDMSESLVLLSDFVSDAEARGIRALDVTEALRGAEPGAFLDHDIHMTPKGNAAVAEALAARLSAPMPLELPEPGLPTTLAFVPERGAWINAPEFTVSGSSKLGCRTLYQQGWLAVSCTRRRKYDGFRHVELLEGERPASVVLANPDGLNIVTPLAPGEPLRARFEFKRSVQELRISWSEGDGGGEGGPKIGGEFIKLDEEPRAEPSYEQDSALAELIPELCECKAELNPDSWLIERGDYDDEYYSAASWDWEHSCGSMWVDLALASACGETHEVSCNAARWSCMQHDPLFAPECPEGQLHAFASNACFAACDDLHPCEQGSCTPWQGGGVCV